jgi:hypothetical protein
MPGPLFAQSGREQIYGGGSGDARPNRSGNCVEGCGNMALTLSVKSLRPNSEALSEGAAPHPLGFVRGIGPLFYL